jgi:hypothetical protein
MLLREMKEKVLKLIEEISDSETTLTDDPDIDKKLNDVINQVMFELARIKKIPAYIEVPVEKDSVKTFEDLETITEDKIYQIDLIQGVDADLRHKRMVFNEEGTAKIYYYKYPTRIDSETIDETYEFELDDDVLEIMPYGVAGDVLKSDVSNNYGQIYSARYNELKQGLDPRNGMQSAYFEGGIDD